MKRRMSWESATTADPCVVCDLSEIVPEYVKIEKIMLHDMALSVGRIDRNDLIVRRPIINTKR